MSAYTKIKTKLNDQEALVYGIKAMGYDPLLYDIAQELAGYSGHRNPKANIVIPRNQLQKEQAAYCDIGFGKLKGEAGFEVFVNDVDQYKCGEGTEFMEELKLNYNVGLAMKKARVAGIKNVRRQEYTDKAKKKHVRLVYA